MITYLAAAPVHHPATHASSAAAGITIGLGALLLLTALALKMFGRAGWLAWLTTFAAGSALAAGPIGQTVLTLFGAVFGALGQAGHALLSAGGAG